MEDDKFNIASQLHGWMIDWMNSCNKSEPKRSKFLQISFGIFPKIIIIKKLEFHLGTTMIVSMAAQGFSG